MAVGIILIPRLMSGAALGPGTISIIIFWIGILVLVPDSISKFNSERIHLLQIPKSTKIIILSCCLYSIFLIFQGTSLYDGQKSNTIIIARRVLSLLHPILCLSWLPIVPKKNRITFAKHIFLLGIFSIIAQSLTHILGNSVIENSITQATASVAGGFLKIFTADNILIEGSSYIFKSHEIKIGSGCASIPQIGLAIQCLCVFMLCCPVSSYFNLMSIGLISIVIAMLLNALRIGLLGIALANYGEPTFNFWHSGMGSLLFSFIIMTVVSIIYFAYWKFDHK